MCELWSWNQTQTRRFRLQLKREGRLRNRSTGGQTMHENKACHDATQVTRNNSDLVSLTRWTRSHDFLHRLADSRPPVTTRTIYLCATTYNRLDFRTAVSELTFRFLCSARLYIRESTVPSCYRHTTSGLHWMLLWYTVTSEKRHVSGEFVIVPGYIHGFPRTESNSKNVAHNSFSLY
jgi:hypothetical protein